jgi:hypothetical protein
MPERTPLENALRSNHPLQHNHPKKNPIKPPTTNNQHPPRTPPLIHHNRIRSIHARYEHHQILPTNHKNPINLLADHQNK